MYSSMYSTMVMSRKPKNECRYSYLYTSNTDNLSTHAFSIDKQVSTLTAIRLTNTVRTCRASENSTSHEGAATSLSYSPDDDKMLI